MDLVILQEEEDRQRDLLEAQIQRAKAAAADEGPAEGTELQRGEDGEPLQMALGGKAKVLAKESRAAFPSAKGFRAEDEVSQPGLQLAFLQRDSQWMRASPCQLTCSERIGFWTWGNGCLKAEIDDASTEYLIAACQQLVSASCEP